MLSFVGAIDPAGVSRCVGLNAVKIKVEIFRRMSLSNLPT